MALNKQIKDWHRIVLDTTLMCALFRSQTSQTMDAQTEFVVRLIAYLTKSKTSDGRERVFYISTITLSELLTKEQDSEKIKRILKVVNSRNVEFIEFDLNTALQFNAHLYPHLDKPSLHKLAEQIGFKTGDYMMAREWITRDFMIIMAGVSKNADVILTADRKTFYPIATEINRLDCVLVYPELFEQSEQFILRYHDDKVKDFLKPPIAAPAPQKEVLIAEKLPAGKI